MGVSIHYRGSISDLDCVEDFENRALDLTLDFGGMARIWRSSADKEPRRMIRGIILNLFPGQETTSLLIAPEGWIINLSQVEDAESGLLTEPPWCFVKTQFGPIEGHVALVEMLDVLKKEFFHNLEVRDEGEYWETRNLTTLIAKTGIVQASIERLAEGFKSYGLNREAAEDQEILLARIERIARMVHRTLGRPAEHPPVNLGAEDSEFVDDTSHSESHWDAAYKANRRRQENVQRAIEEHLAKGKDIADALDAAMCEETAFGLPDCEPQGNTSEDWAEDIEDEAEEPWKEIPPDAIYDESQDHKLSQHRHHPLQQRALDLMLRLHELLGQNSGASNRHLDDLFQGAGDILGGLAQALGEVSEFSSDENRITRFSSSDDGHYAFGLKLVQLKRALAAPRLPWEPYMRCEWRKSWISRHSKNFAT